MAPVARGLFVNTAARRCSIHESGRMIHDIIRRLPELAIDYVEAMDASYAGVSPGDVFARLAEGRGFSAGDYDFTIVNYHHHTLAPFLSHDQVRALPGLKFSIVLEMEPHDPMAFCPRGLFDGGMILDPSLDTDDPTLFPFPRPLDDPGVSLTPERTDPDDGRPVIGSFGYATPGKGFEALVDAVNREFDAAVVRINATPAHYAVGPMTSIHGRDFGDYLADVCARIAKPGVDVRVTRDYMSKGDLLRWCASNTINCFMYTRRQSGLAATTDQAIVSGRPLLVSANETFRHIHRYLRPYPGLSLRRAIAETGPTVARIRRDWSRERFGERFLDMLEARGVPGLRAMSVPRPPPRPPSERPLMLVIPPPGASATDLGSLQGRAVRALQGSVVFRACTLRPEGLATMPDRNGQDAVVDAVVLAGWPGKAAAAALPGLRGRFPEATLLALTSDDHSAVGSFAGAGARPLRGVTPFFTQLSPAPGRPRVALYGFDDPRAPLEAVVRRLFEEAPDAEVIVHRRRARSGTERALLLARLVALRLRRGRWSGLRAALLPRDPVVSVGRFGEASLNLFRAPTGDEPLLRNLVDLALIVERPVAFTREALFGDLRDAPNMIEDASIARILEGGVAAQTRLACDQSEGRLLAEVEELLLAGRKNDTSARAAGAERRALDISAG